jgi:hypothetical protein
LPTETYLIVPDSSDESDKSDESKLYRIYKSKLLTETLNFENVERGIYFFDT